MMNYQTLISLEVIFQVLSSPTRMQILELLASGTRCVNCIAEETELNQPTISQHLRVLRMAGLVTTEKEGKFVHCSVCKETLEMVADYLRDLAERTGECSSEKHECKIDEAAK
ncbi:MAG TPA: ArsR family transcriptional regulator [candidate division Zixibacteria bacterium]|nr:ArsR family transcriptional regulator [candidate division Zixibacteria bacterium]